MVRTAGNPYAIAVNMAAAATGSYALYYMSSKVILPPHLSGAGHWQFLTNLSLIASQIVFTIGGLAHLYKSETLFKIKNNLHPIALAVECVVTMIYWPLRIMFLHLLIKDPKAKLVPLFVDLCLHLFPAIGLAIDYFFFMPKWTVSPRTSFGACLVISASYWWWLKNVIDFENGGEYPYTFLNVPHESTRIVIFGVVALVGFGSFMLLRSLYDLLVVDEETAEKLSVKKAQ